MDAHVRDALVSGFEELVPAIRLPDSDDRHVVAAAIAAKRTSSLPPTSRTSGVRTCPTRARGRTPRCLPGPPLPRVAGWFPRSTGTRPGPPAQSSGFARRPPRGATPGRLERRRDGSPRRDAVDATAIGLNSSPSPRDPPFARVAARYPLRSASSFRLAPQNPSPWRAPCLAPAQAHLSPRRSCRWSGKSDRLLASIDQSHSLEVLPESALDGLCWTRDDGP